MPAPIPAQTLRKVRDMIRSRYTSAEIARECGVGRWTVQNQARLIARFEGRVDRTDNMRLGPARMAGNKARANRGHDFDDAALDLVDIFATPRTSRQMARFMGDE